MSILEKYEKVFLEKDEAGMKEILHDDFKFSLKINLEKNKC